MNSRTDGQQRSLWEVVKEVSEEENPGRIEELVKELGTLLKANEQPARDEDEAR